MRRSLVLLAILSGCTRREAPIVRVHEDMDSKSPPEELPRVRVKADLAKYDGMRAVVEGIFEVDPVVQGKKAQLASIVLSDGTRVVRSYSPIQADLPLIGRHVMATGVVTKGPPDPMAQAVMAPHVKVESLVLAPGETPITPAPSVVPTPPMASSSAALVPHADRWVVVVGDVDKVGPSASAPMSEATLRLSDGSLLLLPFVREKDFAPHLGKQVTVIGLHDKSKGLIGVQQVCAGVVPRCGMDR